MVEVKIVKSKRDVKLFTQFVDKLYNSCDYYVPKLRKNELKLFSQKNANLLSNESIGYLAFQEKKVVGRAMCFINRLDSEKPIVRINHLDFINDASVSNALLVEIEKWAISQKADKIVGTVGFNDLECMGIQNESNSIATLQCAYNYPYYADHLKLFGFTKSKVLKEYRLSINKDISIDDLQNDVYKLLKNNNYRFVEGDKNFKIKFYGRKIIDLMFENSISDFSTMMSDKAYFNYFKLYKSIIKNEDIQLLINENDDLIGSFMLSNNTSVALQTTEGKMLNIKNMYSVGNENEKCIDLNLFVFDKKAKDVKDIMLKKLLICQKLDNVNILNANLWLDSLFVEGESNTYYSILTAINRSILTKNIGKPAIVKRDKSTFVTPYRKSNKTELK